MDYKEKVIAMLNSKELSQEQKEKLENIFPELAESEDEITRKSLIRFLKSPFVHENITDEKVAPWIAWLEKQGEQLTDKVEPKFKVGDWIVFNGLTLYIKEVVKGYYITKGGITTNSYDWNIDNVARLWGIQDAKDGDVLATSVGAFIYNDNNEGDSRPGCYCGINTLGKFQISSGNKWTNKEIYPATKEQRDLLFAQMHDAGYTWDSENKKLKKIEPKSLDPDKVIEWIRENIPIYGNYVMIDRFKKDFEL